MKTVDTKLSKAKRNLRAKALRTKTSKLRKTYNVDSSKDMEEVGGISKYLKALTSSTKSKSPSEALSTSASRKPDGKSEDDFAEHMRKGTAITNKSIDSTMKKHFIQKREALKAKKSKGK